MQIIKTIDSHTEGEPTRVVIEGAPDLGNGDAAARLKVFQEQYDEFRSAVVNEPRGSDAMVGALLLEPKNPKAVAQVLFFNNVGTLHMCVHGTIGLGATLVHMGKIGVGRHLVETPVGDVTLEVREDGSIGVENVYSYRYATEVLVETQRYGTVIGDIAWGGNWFFLIGHHDQEVDSSKLDELTDFAWDIRKSLELNGITGANDEEIDHVEVFGPAQRADAKSKNFVLCPGKAYDRSPCGTGTSAKMACVHASGKLKEGELWTQESIIGSMFSGTIKEHKDGVIPTVSGNAYITGENTLLVDPNDPFKNGIRL